jgi:hypothetical protein
MGQRIADTLYWSGSATVKAAMHECWTLCLEAGEVLTLSLTSTHPIDAVLTDWDAYSDWERARFEGMPAGHNFVNDSRHTSWEEVVTDPPYVLVLVVANPVAEDNRVSIEASVRRIMQTAEDHTQSASSNDMKKPAQHSTRVRWGGSHVG